MGLLGVVAALAMRIFSEGFESLILHHFGKVHLDTDGTDVYTRSYCSRCSLTIKTSSNSHVHQSAHVNWNWGV